MAGAKIRVTVVLNTNTILVYSIGMDDFVQPELFEESEPANSGGAGRFFHAHEELSAVFELSVNAYYAALYAEMSGLPLKKEIKSFVNKVSKAKNREAADKAAADRGDPDVQAVLKAAYKVQLEIHRMRGFLRFTPGRDGVYTARCGPDYFILPALAGHFTLRFGETPWLIIDEKRRLCLSRQKGGSAKLLPFEESAVSPDAAENDPWEDLWRLYHRSANNEARNNADLQNRFMPGRYRRYLSELK